MPFSSKRSQYGFNFLAVWMEALSKITTKGLLTLSSMAPITFSRRPRLAITACTSPFFVQAERLGGCGVNPASSTYASSISPAFACTMSSAMSRWACVKRSGARFFLNCSAFVSRHTPSVSTRYARYWRFLILLFLIGLLFRRGISGRYFCANRLMRIIRVPCRQHVDVMGL